MKLTVNVDDRIVAIARKAWGLARHRASHLMLAAFVLGGAGALAHAATKKHTFSPGTPALAAEVNENFDDLFTAVTAIENELEAGREHSITLAGSAANNDVASSGDGYFYLHPDVPDRVGQLAVPLPAGSVVTGMTCYVYNNSAISATDAQFRALLMSANLSELSEHSNVVASMELWPDQGDEIQSFSATVDSAMATIAASRSYILHLQINPGDAAVPDDYYYSDDSCTECRRLLRHYGCRIDYESPSP